MIGPWSETPSSCPHQGVPVRSKQDTVSTIQPRRVTPSEDEWKMQEIWLLKLGKKEKTSKLQVVSGRGSYAKIVLFILHLWLLQFHLQLLFQVVQLLLLGMTCSFQQALHTHTWKIKINHGFLTHLETALKKVLLCSHSENRFNNVLIKFRLMRP
jgi:hypothetical protein